MLPERNSPHSISKSVPLEKTGPILYSPRSFHRFSNTYLKHLSISEKVLLGLLPLPFSGESPAKTFRGRFLFPIILQNLPMPDPSIIIFKRIDLRSLHVQHKIYFYFFLFCCSKKSCIPVSFTYFSVNPPPHLRWGRDFLLSAQHFFPCRRK